MVVLYQILFDCQLGEMDLHHQCVGHDPTSPHLVVARLLFRHRRISVFWFAQKSSQSQTVCFTLSYTLVFIIYQWTPVGRIVVTLPQPGQICTYSISGGMYMCIGGLCSEWRQGGCHSFGAGDLIGSCHAPHAQGPLSLSCSKLLMSVYGVTWFPFLTFDTITRRQPPITLFFITPNYFI